MSCVELEDLTWANWVGEGLYLKYCNSPKLMKERVLTTPGKSEGSTCCKHRTGAQERERTGAAIWIPPQMDDC